MKLWLPLSILCSTVAFGACGKGDSSSATGAPWDRLTADTQAAPDPAEPRPDLAEGVSKLAARARLSGRREGVVDMVYFISDGTNYTGGTSACTIRIEPNTTNEASVGIVEEYAGGMGDTARAAAWIAAIVSSERAGYLLTDHEFLVRISGHGDGPSAGMLTASAMLALLTDAPIREDSTMSGTINPDGSAGPVGGLVQKMHGAKAKGKTRFGYPVGSRNTMDLETNKLADLEVVGRELGLEVVEINNIAEGYEFMTGRKLPTVELASDSDMALDPDLRTRVKAKLISWNADLNSRAAAFHSKLKAMPQEFQAHFAPIAAQIEKVLTEGKSHLTNGFDVAAYNKAVEAATTLRLQIESIEVLEMWFQGDLRAIDQRIVSLSQVAQKLEALQLELSVNANRKTVGGVVNSVSAYALNNIANAFLELGKGSYNNAIRLLQDMQQGKVQRSNEALGQILDQLLIPVRAFAGADALVQAARESMDLAPEEGATLAFDPTTLAKLTRAYASAASAGLANFEAGIIKPEADANNVSLAQAKAFFSQYDSAYMLAQPLTLYAGHIKGDTDERALVRLSAGITAYISSAGLINKYYSLNLRRQPDGSSRLEGRRALSSQLELAKQSALAAAGESKRLLGFVPVTARMSYENAMALREGDDEDKLNALTEYWFSAFWSRLTVTLARK